MIRIQNICTAQAVVGQFMRTQVAERKDELHKRRAEGTGEADERMDVFSKLLHAIEMEGKWKLEETDLVCVLVIVAQSSKLFLLMCRHDLVRQSVCNAHCRTW